MNRKRGIVSYFAHPLKFVYSINAKAFLVVLKSAKFFHSNLFNPTQAVLHMKFLYMFLWDAYGANTEFMSWAADVKEMYDSLPQEDIIKAITWILKTVQKSSRRDFVCVNPNDRKKHHLEKDTILRKLFLFLLKKSLRFPLLKYKMLTWFLEVLFSFKRKVVQQEAQDHQTVVQLFVFSMNISF